MNLDTYLDFVGLHVREHGERVIEYLQYCTMRTPDPPTSSIPNNIEAYKGSSISEENIAEVIQEFQG